MIAFLTLLLGCLSAKVVTVEKVIVPELDFPTFPLADDMERTSDGMIKVPSEWIVALEEYHIRIEGTEKLYNELKKIYEEVDDDFRRVP